MLYHACIQFPLQNTNEERIQLIKHTYQHIVLIPFGELTGSNCRIFSHHLEQLSWLYSPTHSSWLLVSCVFSFSWPPRHCWKPHRTFWTSYPPRLSAELDSCCKLSGYKKKFGLLSLWIRVEHFRRPIQPIKVVSNERWSFMTGSVTYKWQPRIGQRNGWSGGISLPCVIDVK